MAKKLDLNKEDARAILDATARFIIAIENFPPGEERVSLVDFSVTNILN